MRSLIRSSLVLLCIGTLFASNFGLAQTGEPESQTSKTSRVSLVLFGSVTTWMARKRNTGWFLFGWVVMISGSLSSASRTIKNVLQDFVLADDTELDLYAGKESPENFQAKVAARPFLEKIEMDSLTAVYSPNLANILPMTEVLKQYHLDPERVGTLIVSAKVLGDTTLGGREFADHIVPIPFSKVEADLGELSPSERHIVKNYLRLRNIRLSGS